MRDRASVELVKKRRVRTLVLRGIVATFSDQEAACLISRALCVSATF
jgi:hypothetical protein